MKLVDVLHSNNVIYASGTPIKAMGVKLFLYFDLLIRISMMMLNNDSLTFLVNQRVVL